MLKQIVKPGLDSLIIILAFLMLSHSAFAQLQPAISPWMGMMDRSRGTGALGSYLSNVKPQQDMMRAYASQQGQLRAQQQALQVLRQSNQSGSSSASPLSAGGGAGLPSGDDKKVLNPPREIPSSQNPASFNQYLHYYPPGSLPRRQVPYFSQAR